MKRILILILVALTAGIAKVEAQDHVKLTLVKPDPLSKRIVVRATPDLPTLDSITGNQITGLEFYLKWPCCFGNDAVDSFQSLIPNLVFLEGYSGDSINPGYTFSPEPQGNTGSFCGTADDCMIYIVYVDPVGVDFDIYHGVEFDIAEFVYDGLVNTCPPGSDSITIDLYSDQFHAINWVVWFYGNPFVDLTPSAIDNFYTTDGGEYSDAFCEYEGVTASLLPVELINFDANLIDDAVHLDWSTMTEIDNDYFTIEKTKDGFIFEHVATVDGAGNSNVELDYTAIDNNPYAGTSYYRLKQTDFNGDYSYSHLEPITYNPNTINFTVFPNPSSGSDIQVHLSGAGRDEAITFTILDIAGRVVYQVESSADINGRLTTSLKPKDVLAAGMYTVIGKTEVQEYSEKIVVIK